MAADEVAVNSGGDDVGFGASHSQEAREDNLELNLGVEMDDCEWIWYLPRISW